MIIKAVTAKGDAVPMTAEEAVGKAIVAALVTKNTTDMVFWADTTAAKINRPIRSMNHPDGWEAWVTGEVPVGKTRTMDDQFFTPKPHTFAVHYKLAKDDLGMPSLKIVDFSMAPIQSNPAAAKFGAITAPTATPDPASEEESSSEDAE
jgi:hypothetical protein